MLTTWIDAKLFNQITSKLQAAKRRLKDRQTHSLIILKEV